MPQECLKNEWGASRNIPWQSTPKAKHIMSTYNERTSFIEESGLGFEKLGLTRMAGRILGYLMVSDKEMVCFDELTQVLQASKSSISTNLKTLMNIQYVVPHSLPGDRKTYYMLAPNINWVETMLQRAKLLEGLNIILKKGLTLRVNQNDTPSQWLKLSTHFFDWVIQEYPRFLQQYEKERSKQ